MVRPALALVWLVLGATVQETSRPEPTSAPTSRPKVQLSEVGNFRVLGGAAASVAWSADGRRVASLGEGGDLVVSRTEDWVIERVIDTRAHPCTKVLFDPGGARVATTGRTLAVWDLASGKPLLHEAQPDTAVAAFSPDGRWLAHFDAARQLVLRDARTLGLVRATPWHPTASLHILAFKPDSGTLLSLGPDETLLHVTVGTGAEAAREASPAHLRELGFLADGTRIAGCWRRVFRGARQVDEAPENTRLRVATSADGSTFATCAALELDRAQVRVYRPEPAAPLTIDVPSQVRDLALAPDGQGLVVACADGVLRAWRGSQTVVRRSVHQSPSTGLVFSADSRWLGAFGPKERVYFPLDGQPAHRQAEPIRLDTRRRGAAFVELTGWNLLQERLPGAAKPVWSTQVDGFQSSVRTSPDGESVLLFGGTHGTPGLLLDLYASGPAVRCHLPPTREALWLGKDRIAILQLEARRVQLLNAQGEEVAAAEIGGAVQSLARDRAGRLLLVLTDKRVLVLDADTLATRQELPSPMRRFVCLDDTLAVSADTSALTFWRMPMLAPLEQLPWPGISDLAASEDGQLLAVADRFQVRVLRVKR